MTSHFDSHVTTDLKLGMQSIIKTENIIPHDEEMYAALCRGMLELDIFIQRRLTQIITNIWEGIWFGWNR